MFGVKTKQLTASGQVTTKVSAGSNTLSAPARVLGLTVQCGATEGKIDLVDDGASGTVKFTQVTPAIKAGAEDMLQFDFPEMGLKFDTDLYVYFNHATKVNVIYGQGIMWRLMFSMVIISVLNVYGCIYQGMSMKPHKTSVTTTYGQDEVDKTNDSKDQRKDSMQITVKQEFVWKE